MAETKLNLNQISSELWTRDNLVAGDNVSITQQAAGSGNDESTAGLFHFDGDCVNSGLQSLYTNTFPQIGEAFNNDGKFGQCVYNNVGSDTGKIFLTTIGTISSDNFTMDFWYKPHNFDYSRILWFRIFDTDINGNTSTPGFSFTGWGSVDDAWCHCCGSSGDNLYDARVDFGVWTHFAVEIYNGTTYYYKNGTKIYQALNTTINKTKFGSLYSQSGAQLYLDEVRFSTTARYQGQNFTPPTEPYSGGGQAIYQINAVLPTTIDGGNSDA